MVAIDDGRRRAGRREQTDPGAGVVTRQGCFGDGVRYLPLRKLQRLVHVQPVRYALLLALGIMSALRPSWRACVRVLTAEAMLARNGAHYKRNAALPALRLRFVDGVLTEQARVQADDVRRRQ